MILASFVLISILLVVPFESASAKPALQNVVTLTGSEIDSADDIEAAIIRTTASGTQPGSVILDGQNGDFIFTGEDRSLNIFVSDLTIKGVNGATIVNCDDGLFFDDFPLQKIFVEGITFLCTGDGIEASGSFQDVTLRGNIFWAKHHGIGANGHSSGWLIVDNFIRADWDAINLAGAKDVSINNNHLSGYNGIVMLRDTQFTIHHNTIQAEYQGVRIGQEAWENKVWANTIFGVEAGIALEPGVIDNQVFDNRVMCAPASTCLTVDALPRVAESNKIAGNKP